MRIAIIGCGKMGSWLAAVLAGENEIAVYDKDPVRSGSLSGSIRAKVLYSMEDLGAFRPQMLINAVSLQHTVKAFEDAASQLQKDCMICDLASIKGDIPDYYKKAGYRFVSVHPMFGPTFGNMSALKEENAVIIKGSDPEGAAFFRKLFEWLGVKIFEYTFAEHDSMMAYSLTTPFTASLVFAACMDKGAVPGTTFAKHRMIAKGLLSEDDHLLAEILFNTQSVKQIDKINSRLEFLKHVIKAKDYEEAKRFFAGLRKNVGQ